MSKKDMRLSNEGQLHVAARFRAGDRVLANSEAGSAEAQASRLANQQRLPLVRLAVIRPRLLHSPISGWIGCMHCASTRSPAKMSGTSWHGPSDPRWKWWKRTDAAKGSASACDWTVVWDCSERITTPAADARACEGPTYSSAFEIGTDLAVSLTISRANFG